MRRGFASIGVSLTTLLTTAVYGQTLPPPPPLSPPPQPPIVTAAPVPQAATPTYHDAASGVDVYDVVDDETFPVEWRGERVAVFGTPVAAAARERALRIVRVALSKYPTDLLSKNLRRVYLLSSLKFKGVGASATNSASSLYVSVHEKDARYTDAFIEGSFHHEFGHLLQRNYRALWSVDAWSACNPPGFHYGEQKDAEGGVEAIRGGHASLAMSDDLNRRGFLSEYGTSSASEDFATIVGRLFLGDPDFWRRVDLFPALKVKVALAIGFYGKLDPRFSEPYFRSLRAGTVYAEPASSANPSPETPKRQ